MEKPPGLIPQRFTSPGLPFSAGAKCLLPKERLQGMLLRAAHRHELAPFPELLCESQREAVGLGRKCCSPGHRDSPSSLLCCFQPLSLAVGRHSKHVMLWLSFAFELSGACQQGCLSAVCVSAAIAPCRWQQSPASVVAGLSPCPDAVMCVLGAFLLRVAFFVQKPSIFCHLVGWPESEVGKCSLTAALPFGMDCRVQACLEASGSDAEQV